MGDSTPHGRKVTSVLPTTTWNKSFMINFRDRANWSKGYDSYFETGKLNIPSIPFEIFTESL